VCRCHSVSVTPYALQPVVNSGILAIGGMILVGYIGRGLGLASAFPGLDRGSFALAYILLMAAPGGFVIAFLVACIALIRPSVSPIEKGSS
jgi:hypothetical protein